jgi:predicted regulator of Ras-like GTPase activity (Roadblock/LC7/MglB family)
MEKDKDYEKVKILLDFMKLAKNFEASKIVVQDGYIVRVKIPNGEGKDIVLER